MDFFTVFNGGVGFHGIPWKYHRGNRLDTPLGQRPVSHGCVRMPDDVAPWIFEQLPDGAEVRVVK
jgi:lipoprotein-anchoring transpeptidase ErfK/SrfK